VPPCPPQHTAQRRAGGTTQPPAWLAPPGTPWRLALVAVGATALAIGVAACGSKSGGDQAPLSPNGKEVSPPGDIPDNQAFVAYTPPGGGYSVKVPEGWSRTSANGAVTFTDKLNAIRIESMPAKGPLSVAAVERTELPRLRRTVKGFAPGTIAPVARPAGTGVRITYLADAKRDPVTGRAGRDAVERYLFLHRGKDVVLTLSGPKGADNVDPWRTVTDSLRWSK
jgi:hypothetical protein